MQAMQLHRPAAGLQPQCLHTARRCTRHQRERIWNKRLSQGTRLALAKRPGGTSQTATRTNSLNFRQACGRAVSSDVRQACGHATPQPLRAASFAYNGQSIDEDALARQTRQQNPAPPPLPPVRCADARV